ncbi:Probable plastid-lipid-associated protein 4, chloroplastic [Linum perenne]
MALSSLTTTTFSATVFPGDPPLHHTTLHSSLAPANVVSFSFSRRLPFLATTGNSNNKWRTNVSFLPAFFKSPGKDVNALKQELLQAIAPLNRGADATPDDQKIVDQIARKLESANPTKEPLKSDLLDGKWELIYTTSQSILQTQRPKLLRSRTNYQAINVDTLRAQNMESWPFFNQIPVKAPERARGELEITYLDEELRVSRGDKGNLFVLKMLDPSYRVPV